MHPASLSPPAYDAGNAVFFFSLVPIDAHDPSLATSSVLTGTDLETLNPSQAHSVRPVEMGRILLCDCPVLPTWIKMPFWEVDCLLLAETTFVKRCADRDTTWIKTPPEAATRAPYQSTRNCANYSTASSRRESWPNHHQFHQQEYSSSIVAQQATVPTMPTPAGHPPEPSRRTRAS